MLAHRLRHRVEIQARQTTIDPDTGAATTGWATAVLPDGTSLHSVPAEVLTGPGREFIAANAEQSETTARINMRWFPGLQSTWRILWDGRIYNIRSIETDATARREYRLRCEDGVNDG